mgnify:CR=1 FL=1
MQSLNILDQTSSILLTFFLCFLFVVTGIFYSKKYKGLNNYLVANRNIGTFSLTASLVSSALGAWILFGPASAATWGGVGAVIGYAIGAAFPLYILIYLGQKFRILYPKARTLIEVIRIKFGNKLFKLIYDRDASEKEAGKAFLGSVYHYNQTGGAPRLMPYLRPWLISLAVIAGLYIIGSHLIWDASTANLDLQIRDLTKQLSP